MNQSRLLLSFALCLGACNSTPAARTDSARSGRVIRLAPLDSTTAPQWTTEPVFTTLGRNALLAGVGYSVRAVFAPDSTLWVANASEIVVLHRDGALARTVGRAGDGPGEFRGILSLGLGGDGTIYASELGSGRFTRLRTSGGVAQFIPRITNASAGRENEPVTALDDGRSLGITWQSRPNVNVSDGIVDGPYHRERVTLMAYDSTGAVGDTLGVWPGLQRSAGLPIRFARGVVYDGRGNRTAIGVSDSVDITLFDGASLVRRLVGPASLRAVTPADLLAWREGVKAEMQDLAAFLIKANDEGPAVATLPTVGGVVIDDEGNLWIGEFAVPKQASRRWHIYSAEGKALGVVELPALAPAFLTTHTELLDVAQGRLALLREMPDGELVVEVRNIRR
ncbi:MAG: hypothetical protein V4558_16065 [Gemmatimonadota bacterium]